MNSPSPIPASPGPSGPRRAGAPRIVIRLEQQARSAESDLLNLARQLGYTDLAEFLTARSRIESARVIRHTPPEAIWRKEEIGRRGEFPPVKSLASYWRLHLGPDDEPEEARAELGKMREIEIAYLETEVIEASCLDVSNNDYEGNQHVLDDAPQGIGARRAWCRANGTGQNVSVIDLEYNWILAHEDLPVFSILYGQNGTLSGAVMGDHGAAVLSIIGALNNDRGVVGIAPNLTALNAVSHYDHATGTFYHVADAIEAATSYLKAGDILCIEVQRVHAATQYPVEIDPVDRDAIRLACNQGIIVIEAAGNGNSNLDDFLDTTTKVSLDPDDGPPHFIDTGAVMVGASHYAVVPDPAVFDGHTKYDSSNYGKRIDCYALGQSNYTAGFDDLGANQLGSATGYTSNFRATSAATAIVTGAAALVQGWYRSAWCKQPLRPSQMRAMLSNPVTGTKQALVNQKPIGVMPDLDRIMTFKTRLTSILLCLFSRLNRHKFDRLAAYEEFKQAKP